jgi:polysaccharide biosynthesis/export protein
MWRSFAAILAIVSAFSVSGCASNHPEEGAGAPDRFAIMDGEYRIGVDDRITVNVWKNPDLSVSVPVRPDGMISMPLIGDIRVGGRSTKEVSETVKQKLAVYIREPSVTVIVTELRSHEFISRVRVTGSVRTPKSLPFRQGMTVLDAVLEAGGVNEFAAPNRAKLYRTIKGQTKVYDVELADVLNKGQLSTNYELFPGDVITVPERMF